MRYFLYDKRSLSLLKFFWKLNICGTRFFALFYYMMIFIILITNRSNWVQKLCGNIKKKLSNHIFRCYLSFLFLITLYIFFGTILLVSTNGENFKERWFYFIGKTHSSLLAKRCHRLMGKLKDNALTHDNSWLAQV